MAITVFRILNSETGDFCSSGRGLYAKNGRSVWLGKSGAAIARKYMPPHLPLEIREYELVPIANKVTCQCTICDTDIAGPFLAWMYDTHYNSMTGDVRFICPYCKTVLELRIIWQPAKIASIEISYPLANTCSLP